MNRPQRNSKMMIRCPNPLEKPIVLKAGSNIRMFIVVDDEHVTESYPKLVDSVFRVDRGNLGKGTLSGHAQFLFDATNGRCLEPLDLQVQVHPWKYGWAESLEMRRQCHLIDQRYGGPGRMQVEQEETGAASKVLAQESGDHWTCFPTHQEARSRQVGCTYADVVRSNLTDISSVAVATDNKKLVQPFCSGTPDSTCTF